MLLNKFIVMHNKVCYFLPYVLELNIPTAIMCTACDIENLKFAANSFVHFTASYCMIQCNRLGDFIGHGHEKFGKLPEN